MAYTVGEDTDEVSDRMLVKVVTSELELELEEELGGGDVPILLGLPGLAMVNSLLCA